MQMFCLGVIINFSVIVNDVYQMFRHIIDFRSRKIDKIFKPLFIFTAVTLQAFCYYESNVCCVLSVLVVVRSTGVQCTPL